MRFNQCLLIVRVSMETFFCSDESGAHFNTFCTERHRCHHAATIDNASGCNHWNRHMINHLWCEDKSAGIAASEMPTTFLADYHDGICPEFFRLFCLSSSGNKHKRFD